MKNTRRILCIDGGGIKGVIPAAFLATLEQATGKRVLDHFDLISGTSTGGIIAIGLGLGMSASMLLEFYKREGPAIFSQEPIEDISFFGRFARLIGRHIHSARQVVMPKYRPDALEAALVRAFGDKTIGNSATRLLIPAFDRQRREVHIFKTSHHPRFELDWKERAVDVALATSAAPTYLPGHQLSNGISLLDGGIWANNPVGLAAVEAVSILEWPRESLNILSLGCSETPAMISDKAGYAGVVLKMADVFMLGQSRGAIGTAKLLMGPQEGRQRLFRYQHIASEGEFALDSVAQINTLQGIGVSLAREALPTLKVVFMSDPREEFVPYHRAV